MGVECCVDFAELKSVIFFVLIYCVCFNRLLTILFLALI